MGLDQYLKRYSYMTEEEKRKLPGRISYDEYKILDGKYSFVDVGMVRLADKDLFERYGVKKDVEFPFIDWEAAFNREHPDIDFNDCVQTGSHGGPDGSGCVYTSRTTGEKYRVELSTEEEKEYERRKFFPCYILRCETVVYWQNCRFICNWLDDHFQSMCVAIYHEVTEDKLEELDTDCHLALKSIDEYKRIFDDVDFDENAWDSIKEDLCETIDQISTAYERTDWEAGDVLMYTEWY